MSHQLQLSILQISFAILNMAAQQRCAKRARLGNEKVARRRGAQDRETERDEHPDRKGDWNCRSEVTGTAWDEQLGGVQFLPQGLAMGTFASSDGTRRWTCSVRPARAPKTTRRGSTGHPVNQHRHACVERCPLTTKHTANRSGDNCGESQ